LYVAFHQILGLTKVKGVHPLIDHQFRYVCLAEPLLDLAGISTRFCGAISTQFCFVYLLEGVTAMPRGLQARLNHAFLVLYLF